MAATVSTPAPAAAAGRALRLAPDWPRLLAGACAGTGLRAVYQPLVNLQHGEVVGFEGLSRFASADVSPERWFAAARHHGCEAALEAATLRMVLAGREDLPPGTFLSVNVSPTTLASDAVTETFEREQDLRGVVIELTEQMPIRCYEELTGALNRCRSRGALIALDDTGSGYAGLSRILELRPSILKLDRSLISGVNRDEAKRIVVEMLGLFAGHLDGWVLAEGIETLAELETLRQMGVPLGQGYALGRPAPRWPRLDPEAATMLAEAPTIGNGYVVTLLVERVRTVPVAERQRGAADPRSGWLPSPAAGPRSGWLPSPAAGPRSGWLPSPAAGAASGGGEDFVVAVDDLGAPAGTWTPASARAGTMGPVLAVPSTITISDLARRALLRPAPHRFEPVVCTDPSGRTMGVVRMERVLDTLARQV